MTPLVSLGLATLAFVGTHLAMSHPLRASLIARLGPGGFLGAYSLVSLVTLGWMILAYRSGDDGGLLWVAPLWWWPIASALMLVASILLVGSLFGNPAMPDPTGRAPRIAEAKGVFAITRHPMNSSFILWALVHISLSGSPRNLIVACGILLLASVGSLGQDRKKAALFGETWRGWMARTSFMPFGALVAGRAAWRNAFPGWIALLGGLALWTVVTSFHAPLVSPIGDLLAR